MPEDRDSLENGLRELREKTDKLEGGLPEDEAMKTLEEAVAEVEHLGEQLEKGES